MATTSKHGVYVKPLRFTPNYSDMMTALEALTPVEVLLTRDDLEGRLKAVDMVIEEKKAKPKDADGYLTVAEVARLTRLSTGYLYELGRKGDLKIARLGKGKRGYRVLQSDLVAWEKKARG